MREQVVDVIPFSMAGCCELSQLDLLEVSVGGGIGWTTYSTGREVGKTLPCGNGRVPYGKALTFGNKMLHGQTLRKCNRRCCQSGDGHKRVEGMHSGNDWICKDSLWRMTRSGESEKDAQQLQYRITTAAGTSCEGEGLVAAIEDT